MLETIVVFLVTFMVLVFWWRSRPRNIPPSPGLALPLIGHLYLFKGDPIQQIQEWRERLGNVYSLQMGPFRCVMLSGYDAISTCLTKHHNNLLERPNNFSHEETFHYAGIISLGGEQWKEQRRFLQSTLRSLGVGKNIMADRISEEVNCLLKILEDTGGEGKDVGHDVMVCVTNVLCGVVMGKRFDHKDETIRHWLAFVKRLFNVLGAGAVINFYPVLKYIPGDMFKYKELSHILGKMRHTLWAWIDKENRHINIADESFNDIAQAFLTEMKRKQMNGDTSTSINDPNLLSTTMSLFIGGTETTTNTIVFALLYMIRFPEIQERLFQEIRDNVGLDKTPGVEDRVKLKYLAAFIMETQRISSVVPIGIDRLSTNDIQLNGFTIPKGTSVMVNYDSILMDGNVWESPEIFRPERFISDDGTLNVKKEFLPFGIGKRNCLGEPLASMQLFMFISALVQRFEFRSEDADDLPSMIPDVGFSKCAKPFKLRAFPRKRF